MSPDILKIVYVILYFCSRPISFNEAEGYAKLFQEIPPMYGFKPSTILALASYENRWFDPTKVSKTKDSGLMQIHCRSEPCIKLFQDPSSAIHRGCQKLKFWKDRKRVKTLPNLYQYYNSRSKGYGVRVNHRRNSVLALFRKYDKNPSIREILQRINRSIKKKWKQHLLLS